MPDPFASGGDSQPTAMFTDGSGLVWRVGGAGEALPVMGPDGNQLRGGGTGGNTFEQDMALASATRHSTSSSSSTSQSFQDPAVLQLQREQLAQEQALASQKLQQESQIALQNLNLGLQTLNQRTAADQQNMQFLREKLKIETDAGQQDRAQRTQEFASTLQLRLNDQNMQRVQFQTQIRQENAKLAFAAQQANQQAKQAADQINEQRRTANLEARRGNALDVAGLSKDPGDRTALAAYLNARGGQLGALGTGMAQGADFRTEESLTPLREALGLRDELAKGPQTYTPEMITAPQTEVPNTPEFTAPVPTTPTTPAPAAAAPNGLAAPAPPINFAGLYPNAGTWNPNNAKTGFTGSVDANGNLVATPQLEQGGIVDQLFGPATAIVGDSSDNQENQELAMALPGGKLVVIPLKGKKAPKGVKKAETGGVFGAPTPATTADPARAFLDQAFGSALKGSPWAGGTPTPISVAAAGTSPFLQRYAAGLASSGRGVMDQLFAEELAKLKPISLAGQGVVRRSA